MDSVNACDSNELRKSANQAGTFSGTLGVDLDVDLLVIVDAWQTLTEMTKLKILDLVDHATKCN